LAKVILSAFLSQTTLVIVSTYFNMSGFSRSWSHPAEMPESNTGSQSRIILRQVLDAVGEVAQRGYELTGHAINPAGDGPEYYR
jgi:hypothetical protein